MSIGGLKKQTTIVVHYRKSASIGGCELNIQKTVWMDKRQC